MLFWIRNVVSIIYKIHIMRLVCVAHWFNWISVPHSLNLTFHVLPFISPLLTSESFSWLSPMWLWQTMGTLMWNREKKMYSNVTIKNWFFWPDIYFWNALFLVSQSTMRSFFPRTQLFCLFLKCISFGRAKCLSTYWNANNIRDTHRFAREFFFHSSLVGRFCSCCCCRCLFSSFAALNHF